jgi:hypothetical protein
MTGSRIPPSAVALRPLSVSPRVWESLTRSDHRLLERLEAEKRIEVSSLRLDAEHVFWLAYYGFVLLEVDLMDCVFLIRNPEVMSTLRRKAS